MTADLDRLLDETAGVDPRGLEVHVSPDDRVVPDVNALQIAEGDSVELNALADRRSPEPVEGIQDRGPSQHPERAPRESEAVDGQRASESTPDSTARTPGPCPVRSHA